MLYHPAKGLYNSHLCRVIGLLGVPYVNADKNAHIMQSSPILLIFLVLAISGVAVFLYIFHKRNGHTELYSEGVRHENDGQYTLALDNYEDALSEIRKLNLHDKFGEKIAERIKILRTTIAYERNFQTIKNQGSHDR